MQFTHDHFTMSYHQSRDYGIDYRDCEKVARLPEGKVLVAVAGVYGDARNIHCLFVDEDGNCYLRNIVKWDTGFFIRELRADAKEIKVGQVFLI